jgi:serine/threonine-protein kinase RsbW
MSMPTIELTLHFLRKLDYLRLATGISRLICATLPESDLEKDFVDHLELAVSEACTNAIRHTKDPDAEATVGIRFEVHENQLVVEVKDQGQGFDLEKIPLPDFDKHPEGGYGLFIMRTVMDEVFYTKADEYNTLTMKKYFRKPE